MTVFEGGLLCVALLLELHATTIGRRDRCTLSHAKQDRSEILGVHWRVFDICSGEQLSAKRFDILLRPLTG